MGNFNKYNDRSLSQLLKESAEILDEEFPPAAGGAGSAIDDAPAPATDDIPPDVGDEGPPPGGEEEGAESTPEGLCNQIRDLLDQLCAKLGVGGDEEIGGETEGAPPEPSDAAPPPSSASAPPPPMESRGRKIAARR
jgi:hypothetical protein